MTENNESPCKTCDRKDKDKRVCFKICDRLEAWQDEDPQWDTFRIPTPEELGETATGHPKTDQKICKVEGCDGDVKCRGFCLKHYDLWRRGKLPQFPRFTPIQKRPPRRDPSKKKPAKKAATKKPMRLPIPKSPEAPAGLAPSRFGIDLTDYPAMRDAILETAAEFFIPPQHVIISLMGSALAIRAELAKARK